MYYSLSLVFVLGLFDFVSEINRKRHYVWLHNILKFIIVAGVFSILLIDVELVLNQFYENK